MSNSRNTGFLTNVIKVDATGNVSFVSGSTTLATISTSGQMSGSLPALSSSYALSASYVTNAETLDGLDSTVFTLTSSFNTLSSSLLATSGSFNTRVTALEVTGSALSSSILSVSASSYLTSGSLSSASGSFNTRISTVESKYATTGSNTFRAPQYVTDTTVPSGFANSTGSIYTDGGLLVAKDSYFSSSMFIKGNLTIYGTQSIAYITSSQLNIATNLITVNTATPAVRFGGLAVYDSGSTGTGMTGSLLWDSQNNSWIYDNPSGSGNYDSAMVIMGPRNASALGSEQGLTCNYLVQGHGHHHTTSSLIYHDGSITCIYNNTTISSGGGVYSSLGSFSCIGIGTASPAVALHISATTPTIRLTNTSAGSGAGSIQYYSGSTQAWNLGTHPSNDFYIYNNNTATYGMWMCSANNITVFNNTIYSCGDLVSVTDLRLYRTGTAPAVVLGSFNYFRLVDQTSGNSVNVGTGGSGLFSIGGSQYVCTATALNTSLSNPVLTLEQRYADMASAEYHGGALALAMNSTGGDTWLGGVITAALGTTACTGGYPGGLGFWVKAANGTKGCSGLFQGMKLDYAGRLGIGSTTPTQLLHLYTTQACSAGVGSAIQIESGGPGGDIGFIGVNKGTGNGLIIGDQNRDIIFQTGNTSPFNGTERMRITNGGNVNIVTTTGNNGTQFNVKTDASHAQQIEAIATGGNKSIYLKAVDSGINTISSNYISSGPYLPLALTARETNSDLYLGIDGKIGMGTTCPVNPLTIYNATNPGVRLQNSTSGAASNRGADIYTDTSDFWIRNIESGILGFATNNTERMRITNAGAVIFGAGIHGGNLSTAGGSLFTSSGGWSSMQCCTFTITRSMITNGGGDNIAGTIFVQMSGKGSLPYPNPAAAGSANIVKTYGAGLSVISSACATTNTTFAITNDVTGDICVISSQPMYISWTFIGGF